MSKKAWFGPKRIGYGVRPQTWQGWMVIAVAVIIIIALTSLH
ncbi:MAG: hypothetical protein PXZ08_10545 [Actinomycetota bacterium]|jgi:hypothetical protein|nr:hypothetical protein [Actinomycetota bacterium]